MNRLGQFLDPLARRYHRKEFLPSDPLEFVHRFPVQPGSGFTAHDQEAVALLSGLLAYGNVKQIRRSVQGALDRIHQVSPNPRTFVEDLGRVGFEKEARQQFRGWVHRFNTGSDLIALFKLLSRSWARHGSVGAQFVQGLQPDDPHIGMGLELLIQDWAATLKSWRISSRGARFFLTAPSSGSCCKRWCMFLRWMGRKDELDPGLWGRNGKLAGTFPEGRFVRPDQLVIPLDTHLARLSRYLGLTERKAPDWKTALEVTEALKKIDPRDPIRYDFALSRLGILDLCSGKISPEVCGACGIRPVCLYAGRHAGRG